MKFLTFFLLALCFNASAQSSQIPYKDSLYHFSVSYPSDWDTSAFNNKKEELKLAFASVIYLNKNPVGTFTIKAFNVPGAMTMKEMLEQNQASLKEVYSDSKIIDAETKKSENNLFYNYLLVEINQHGVTRTSLNVQFVNNNKVYILDFASSKEVFDKLKDSLQQIINSFNFK